MIYFNQRFNLFLKIDIICIFFYDRAPTSDYQHMSFFKYVNF